jgi:hypothetical protein
MFTVSRLGVSPGLAHGLVSTNVIESLHSGERLRAGPVCHWRDGKMVLRSAATALLKTVRSFRKIMAYRDLCMLKAALNGNLV